jgi:hypothetical protein
MTTDRRPPTTDRRPPTGEMSAVPCHPVILSPCHRVIRWLSLVVLCADLLLTLAACGAAPGDVASQAGAGGGSRISPDIVARQFFEEFGKALGDPELKDETRRSKLAEQLAAYFAPNERDDQRAALNAALNSFADGLARLDANQTLTLELRITDVRILSEDGNRALVRPVNGTAAASIYLLIAHTDDRGVVIPEFEQEIGFDKMIDRPDGAVPAIKIGDRWYLTEG